MLLCGGDNDLQGLLSTLEATVCVCMLVSLLCTDGDLVDGPSPLASIRK